MLQHVSLTVQTSVQETYHSSLLSQRFKRRSIFEAARSRINVNLSIGFTLMPSKMLIALQVLFLAGNQPVQPGRDVVPLLEEVRVVVFVASYGEVKIIVPSRPFIWVRHAAVLIDVLDTDVKEDIEIQRRAQVAPYPEPVASHEGELVQEKVAEGFVV